MAYFLMQSLKQLNACLNKKLIFCASSLGKALEETHSYVIYENFISFEMVPS
jgi:hypothetical protein